MGRARTGKTCVGPTGSRCRVCKRDDPSELGNAARRGLVELLVADDLEQKRAELNRVLDKLAKLERDNADTNLVREYRALARQLGEQISDIEQREGGET